MKRVNNQSLCLCILQYKTHLEIDIIANPSKKLSSGDLEQFYITIPTIGCASMYNLLKSNFVEGSFDQLVSLFKSTYGSNLLNPHIKLLPTYRSEYKKPIYCTNGCKYKNTEAAARSFQITKYELLSYLESGMPFKGYFFLKKHLKIKTKQSIVKEFKPSFKIRRKSSEVINGT